MSHHLGGARLATGLLLGLLPVLLVAGCSDADEEPVGAPPATLPQDFCAVLEPLVPPDLGLGDPVVTTHGSDGTTASTGCTLTGADGARLEAELTSYALADADDLREVDLAKGAACDQLLGRPGSTDEEEDDFDCRAILADGTVSTVDQVIQHRALLRMELALPEKLGEQAAAYSSGIRYAIVTETEDLD